MTLVRPRPSSSPAPGKSGGGAGSGARGDGGGARPRAWGLRSRCGQAPHPLQGPGYSPQRCSSETKQRHRCLFRPLRTPLFATTPLAAAVAAVLDAAPAAAARVRFHALHRGRARATARWRHLATDRQLVAASGDAGPESRLRRLLRLFRTDPTFCPSRAEDPRVWLPCRHLAPGKSRHHTSLYGVTGARHYGWEGPGRLWSDLVQTAADPIGKFLEVQEGSPRRRTRKG
nr:uncharacterized protein LOC129039041 isoform X1 [Pongo pygmaeus]XP_054348563.1 uncharacterized protein LOC129039041 isoform X1 [Pongo pygmaeus]